MLPERLTPPGVGEVVARAEVHRRDGEKHPRHPPRHQRHGPPEPARDDEPGDHAGTTEQPAVHPGVHEGAGGLTHDGKRRRASEVTLGATLRACLCSSSYYPCDRWAAGRLT